MPNVPGDETREPAFGMKALWVPEVFSATLKSEGFTPVDNMSVLLTHLGETIRNNLAQLFSYKDFRKLIDGLEPEYKRLLMRSSHPASPIPDCMPSSKAAFRADLDP